VIYGGSLDRILEACARAGTPQKCSAGPKYYGRGPVLITGADNYAAMGKFLGLDLTSNPDLLLDTNSTAGWKSALAFW
jgi:predicted chitinase